MKELNENDKIKSYSLDCVLIGICTGSIVYYFHIHMYLGDYYGIWVCQRLWPIENLLNRWRTLKKTVYDYYFDGVILRASPGTDGKLKILCLSLTNPKYRFGKNELGIGSSLDEVKASYSYFFNEEEKGYKIDLQIGGS